MTISPKSYTFQVGPCCCSAGLSFAQVPVLQFLLLCHAGGWSHRFLSHCSSALLSARLGWTGLSSAPVGWAPFGWTGGHPHQSIPCWCCHPTPIDLRFAAFLSAPHPLTTLQRKVQGDLQGSTGTRSTGTNPNSPNAGKRKRQNGSRSGGGLLFSLKPRPQ